MRAGCSASISVRQFCLTGRSSCTHPNRRKEGGRTTKRIPGICGMCVSTLKRQTSSHVACKSSPADIGIDQCEALAHVVETTPGRGDIKARIIKRLQSMGIDCHVNQSRCSLVNKLHSVVSSADFIKTFTPAQQTFVVSMLKNLQSQVIKDMRLKHTAKKQQPESIASTLPVALVSPELGLIHEAAYSEAMLPRPRMYEAALELCNDLSETQTEYDRRVKFTQWHNRWFQGLSLQQNKPQADEHNDAVTVAATEIRPCCVKFLANNQYLVVLMDTKHSTGSRRDLHVQLIRQYQAHYGNGAAWHDDVVVRATGMPAILLELKGRVLTIYGAFMRRHDSVVCEPLTPGLKLVALHARQTARIEQLARVLTAYEAAAMHLQLRLVTALPENQSNTAIQLLKRHAEDVISNVCQISHQEAYQSVLLTPGSIEAAAAARVCGAAQLPYPLTPGSNYHSISQLPGFASKLLYEAVTQDARHVVIKFTAKPYPVQIHEAWQAKGLVPDLIEYKALPGNWWMIVMEKLDDEWVMLCHLSAEEQTAVWPHVKNTLTAMHSTTVPVDSAGTNRVPVHGDFRGPNIMVKLSHEGGDEAGDGNVSIAVKVVDLGWAGIAGKDRYPPSMSKEIRWHHDARPGMPLAPEHDWHLLEKYGRNAAGTA